MISLALELGFGIGRSGRFEGTVNGFDFRLLLAGEVKLLRVNIFNRVATSGAPSLSVL